MLDLNRIPEAVRYEGGISRRLMLAYVAALAAIPTVSRRVQGAKPGKFSDHPFQLGVASGEPTSQGFVIWTRLAPRPAEIGGGLAPEAIELQWEVAADDAFRKVLQSGKVAAAPELGHSVHVTVKELEPDSWYWYRFHCGDATSAVGRARTMPAPDSLPEKLRFAFASCQNYEDGLYTAYQHMAQDDLDLVFFLGDYIYEFSRPDPAVRQHWGPKCKSLNDYRLRYCQYKTDPLLQAMHAHCPWVMTWDDHEVEGNYANAISKNKDKGVTKAEFLVRRAQAYQAYYEMMPLRDRAIPEGADLRLYHQTTFGKLASFKVLDTRQYRTNQPNDDEKHALNAAALDPENTLLGAKQKKWLKESLLESQSVWNVLAQQVMMGMVDRTPGEKRQFSMDAWTGYAFERMELVKFLAERRVSNPVVLSGDIHSNWVNDLRIDDRKSEQPIVATEFIGTSISSGGNGQTVERQKLSRLKDENPCVKFHDEHRGYVRCTVTPEQWQSDFRVVPEVTKPGGKVVTQATFVVDAGKAGAHKG